MISKRKVIISNSFNPYFNLSLEEYLLNNIEEDEMVLYLWRNENTVVIGRNQNPWKECNLEKLSNMKGKIARRLSGGGAVYHDLGNLNFTFLTGEKNEDLSKQLSVIIEALKEQGIESSFSGRNDILVDGKKISGNAFYWDNNKYYHHGTLLYKVDVEKLTAILTPPTHKLTSKGIDSVKSRVANLKEYREDLTIESLMKSLIRAFEVKYGEINDIKYLDEEVLDLHELTNKYSSSQWIYGDSPDFHISIDRVTSEGKIEINISAEDSEIKKCKIYTDSLYTKEFTIIEKILEGCVFNKDNIIEVLDKNRQLFSCKGKIILDLVKEMIIENVPKLI
ncbi:lipoate--protein ligase [Clostridium sp. MSJ-11]|uniref:lipoate--protein ligase n=1 Tax=Clostridium mobile TaxID=2841512 RepID=A0ABS6EL12_9CLOT|nr:lipoate--protein ligase [Clostridium mobile]MBU5485897.1 lipoate--protein ligase [Clostridium mobile]